MSPARLLEHFDRLIDTPDAVPRLRRFILDLAVRGKLVEQDPKDESAGELLKGIRAKKTGLAKTGEIRKEKPPLPINDDEILFEVPQTWRWTRLGDISAYLQRGKSPKYAAGEGALVVSQRCVQWDGLHLEWAKKITTESLADYEPIRFLRSGDLLWNSTGTGTIGRVLRLDNPGERLVCDSHVTIVRCLGVDERFVCIWLQSDFVYGTIEDRAAGATNQVELTASIALKQVTPIPPLAEQHRIVAKVDELMALCDELEAAQTKREKRRDRLVAATLHGLNNGDTTPTPGAPSTFEESARFYFNHLPRLATRPEHIHQLRQTILNLAVRGKLVPQDPKDQPASLLIEEIRKEKRTLIGQGSIKKGKPPQELGNPAPFFDLPKGWSWVHLGELAKMVTSGSRDWAQHYSAQGAIFVRMGNLSRGSYQLRLNHIQRVKPPDDTEGARTKLEEGDLLVSITGEAGLLGLIPANFGEAYINQHTCLVRPMPQLKNRYLPELFRSPFAQDQFNEPQRGIKNSLRLTDVTEFLVPLPPLAEQNRIVAKLDELMALCDGLEGGIARTMSLLGASLEANLVQSPA